MTNGTKHRVTSAKGAKDHSLIKCSAAECVGFRVYPLP